MRAVPDALCQRPFSLATASRYGVTPRQLQGRRFRRLFRGVYASTDLEITTTELAEAVSCVLPVGGVVSGTTAALLHGADVRRIGDHDVTVTSLRDCRIRRPGIRATAAFLEQGDVVEVHGIPVTSPVRTAFDLARQRDLIERVVGVDAMLNRGACTLEGLAAYVADRPTWRGIRWAREALSHAEPLSESVMESRQRMWFVLEGLPRPTAQYVLSDRSGGFIARLDHAFEPWLVAPEWDGAPHAQAWRRDNERQQRIRDQGWWHRRYTTESVRDGWYTMVLEVRAALCERGWRPAEPSRPDRFPPRKG